MEKIKVREVILVEGKYDKIRLSSLIDGYILQTDGFHIFADPDKMALIRRLAAARGVLVLTDSDSAGFLIRNYLRGVLPGDQVRHAYIPDVFGKERRKARPSSEGKLGVEGMDTASLREALRRAGVGSAQPFRPTRSRGWICMKTDSPAVKTAQRCAGDCCAHCNCRKT